MPIARRFPVYRAKNLLIDLVLIEPRPSKLAPVRYQAPPTAGTTHAKTFGSIGA